MEERRVGVIISIPVSSDRWEELRRLLAVPHEHGKVGNECLVCDEPIVNAAIKEIKKLREQVADLCALEDARAFRGPG